MCSRSMSKPASSCGCTRLTWKRRFQRCVRLGQPRGRHRRRENFLGRLDGKSSRWTSAAANKYGRCRRNVADGSQSRARPLLRRNDHQRIRGWRIAARGRVRAFSAKSGKSLWTFYTVPGPGEAGHDSWPQDNSAWQYGGAMVWQTPAVDAKHGLIYFSTGNAAPDFNGSLRKGDNLYLGLHRRDRSQDGQVPLAFSAGAS